jgi:hypothetical protein
LQPYLKISGVETISSGGKLRNGYQQTRANLDGVRAELGAGLIWQLDANNQLHLDYEASFGDKYDKPWGLTAGYRYQFGRVGMERHSGEWRSMPSRGENLIKKTPRLCLCIQRGSALALEINVLERACDG